MWNPFYRDHNKQDDEKNGIELQLIFILTSQLEIKSYDYDEQQIDMVFVFIRRLIEGIRIISKNKEFESFDTYIYREQSDELLDVPHRLFLYGKEEKLFYLSFIYVYNTYHHKYKTSVIICTYMGII